MGWAKDGYFCVQQFVWRKRNSIHMEVGLSEQKKTISDLYRKACSGLPKVPVFLAEDETAIIANIVYSADRDVRTS